MKNNYALFPVGRSCMLGVVLMVCLQGTSLANKDDINGFRDASFGSAKNVVMDAIVRDFGIARSQIKEIKDSRTGTELLEVELEKLDPITAPVKISYTLGYKCNCLIQVNVVWKLPETVTMTQRQDALVALSELARHFSNKPSWEGGEVITDRVPGEAKDGQTTNYFFFRGVTAANSAVSVWGAPVTMVKNKTAPGLVADIDKVKLLAVTYELNVKTPDLKKIDVERF
ncbi:MAG: hypothetical protein IT287_04675 [Bdellovibrionaceae bacterium]|nr:hypothetical protein [Pseudobdellovibrionaceae bacterium]